MGTARRTRQAQQNPARESQATIVGLVQNGATVSEPNEGRVCLSGLFVVPPLGGRGAVNRGSPCRLKAGLQAGRTVSDGCEPERARNEPCPTVRGASAEVLLLKHVGREEKAIRRACVQLRCADQSRRVSGVT